MSRRDNRSEKKEANAFSTPASQKMKAELNKINRQIREFQEVIERVDKMVASKKAKDSKKTEDKAPKPVEVRVKGKTYEQLLEQVEVCKNDIANRKIALKEHKANYDAAFERSSTLLSQMEKVGARVPDQKNPTAPDFTKRNLDAIEKKIENIERRMGTARLSLQQEKQLVARIKSLRKTGPIIEDYQRRVALFRTADKETKRLKGSLNSHEKGVAQAEASLERAVGAAEAKKARGEKKATLIQKKTARTAQRPSGDPLVARRAAIVKKLNAVLVRFRTLTDKYEAARAEFFAKKLEERATKIAKYELAKEKELQRRARENLERQAEEKEEKEETIPFSDEINQCQHLLTYLKSVLPIALIRGIPDGYTAQPLSHAFSTFAEFQDVNLKTPMTDIEVPASIRAVKKALRTYKQKSEDKIKESKQPKKPKKKSTTVVATATKEETTTVVEEETTTAVEEETTTVEEETTTTTTTVVEEEEVAAKEEEVTAAVAEETPAAEEEEEDSDDDVDLFAVDAEADAAAAALEKKKEEEAAAAKDHGYSTGGRSSVVLDIKPEDIDTNLEEVETKVRALEVEGLEWKAGELVPIAFGLKLLRISCIIKDDLVSVDDLEEKISALDEVQSVDT